MSNKVEPQADYFEKIKEKYSKILEFLQEIKAQQEKRQTSQNTLVLE